MDMYSILEHVPLKFPVYITFMFSYTPQASSCSDNFTHWNCTPKNLTFHDSACLLLPTSTRQEWGENSTVEKWSPDWRPPRITGRPDCGRPSWVSQTHCESETQLRSTMVPRLRLCQLLHLMAPPKDREAYKVAARYHIPNIISHPIDLIQPTEHSPLQLYSFTSRALQIAIRHGSNQSHCSRPRLCVTLRCWCRSVSC